VALRDGGLGLGVGVGLWVGAVGVGQREGEEMGKGMGMGRVVYKNWWLGMDKISWSMILASEFGCMSDTYILDVRLGVD